LQHMALDNRFVTLINEGRITRSRVAFLEAQIADLQLKADQEFRDLSPEVRSELVGVLEDGIVQYVQEVLYNGHERGKMLGDAIPHTNSNFFDLARRYLAKTGQQMMFGAKLIFRDVCGFHYFYEDTDGNLRATAFEEHEKTHHSEYPHLPFPSHYAKCMSEGTPEVVETDGTLLLKIYRGLRVPTDTFSEDHERKAGTIDSTNPGVNWTPILAFTQDYQGEKGERVLLSALIPLNDDKILRESIDSSSLDETWRGEHDAPLEKLTDCLIVIVPESRYHLLRDLKVEYTDASFERT
jgi:hypothetical protein